MMRIRSPRSVWAAISKRACADVPICANNDEPILIVRMVGIVKSDREWVIKYGRGFGKGDAVLL